MMKEQERTTYYEGGKRDCKNANAEEQFLKTSLDDIYTKIKSSNLEREVSESEKLKDIASELNSKEALLKVNKEEIDEDRKELIRFKKEYTNEIKVKGSKLKFTVGLLILIPLTIYLIIFYTSASYSGFFRQIDEYTTVTKAIFYSKAIPDAYKEGGLFELGFIFFMPFIFLALGYLIHLFYENIGKYINKVKVSALIVITFIFDSILAYSIEYKLAKSDHEINRTLKTSPFEFGLGDAIGSSGFWLIIFAGFVAYLLWGMILDFVMKEYREVFEGENYELKKKIKIKGENIEKAEKENKEIKKEIEKARGEIDIIKNHKIKDIIIEKTENCVSEYLRGWKEIISNQSININVPSDSTIDKVVKKLLEDSQRIYDDFINELKEI